MKLHFLLILMATLVAMPVQRVNAGILFAIDGKPLTYSLGLIGLGSAVSLSRVLRPKGDNADISNDGAFLFGILILAANSNRDHLVSALIEIAPLAPHPLIADLAKTIEEKAELSKADFTGKKLITFSLAKARGLLTDYDYLDHETKETLIHLLSDKIIK